MSVDKCVASVKLWLSEPLELELRRLADTEQRPLSEYIRVVLQHHVYGHRATSATTKEGARGDD